MLPAHQRETGATSAKPRTAIQRTRILGIPVAHVSAESLPGLVESLVAKRGTSILAPVNIDIINRAVEDPQLRAFLERADLVYSDGAGPVLGSLILGAVAGGLSALAVGLKYRFGYDDSLDVVGVHLVAGLWGTIGAGLLSTSSGLFYGGGIDQTVVQILVESRKRFNASTFDGRIGSSNQ